MILYLIHSQQVLQGCKTYLEHYTSIRWNWHFRLWILLFVQRDQQGGFGLIHEILSTKNFPVIGFEHALERILSMQCTVTLMSSDFWSSSFNCMRFRSMGVIIFWVVVQGWAVYSQKHQKFSNKVQCVYTYTMYMYIQMKLMNDRDDGQQWVLVLPPWSRLYHWKNRDVEHMRIPWSRFFDLDSMRRHVPVIELEDWRKGELCWILICINIYKNEKLSSNV